MTSKELLSALLSVSRDGRWGTLAGRILPGCTSAALIALAVAAARCFNIEFYPAAFGTWFAAISGYCLGAWIADKLR